jgi:L-amino acid N-acyltransferase YncA
MKTTEIDVTFRSLVKDDWKSVTEIYRQGIETGNATFENEIPTWNKWDSTHLKFGRIVAQFDNVIVAWAALTPVSDRCVYSGVAEVSVYVANKYQGIKIGTKILERLISESEDEGIWSLQASIFPENKASLKMHENLGFRIVGHREKIGKMNGIWRDTTLLERRSKVIGLQINS